MADEKIPAYLQKAQSDREYRDYLNWKRTQDRERIYKRVERSYRPIRTKDYCKGRYEIEGTKMLFEGLARDSAIKAWERVARAREAEEFADWNFAADKDMPCWKVGRFKRCRAIGIACRP